MIDVCLHSLTIRSYKSREAFESLKKMPVALENPSRELEVTSRSVQQLVLDGFKGFFLDSLTLSLSLFRTDQKISELVYTHENSA